MGLFSRGWHLGATPAKSLEEMEFQPDLDWGRMGNPMYMDGLRWEEDKQGLVRTFCTAPAQEETEFDRKAFARAQSADVEIPGRRLRVHAMGSGPDVLLVHGWNSRASHMAVLARFLERKGFRAVVLDAPAHGDSRRLQGEDISSGIEFGRAISAVSRTLSPGFSVVGHSMGAQAAAFVAAGTGLQRDHRIHPRNLVLISSPEGLDRVIENYCRHNGMLGRMETLSAHLEAVFDFKIPDYSIAKAAKDIGSRILVVHDEQDEEIPLSDARRIQEGAPGIRLFLTQGFGHRKILTSRGMFQAVADFLSEGDLPVRAPAEPTPHHRAS